VHLVGFTMKYITIQGPMNVKLWPRCSIILLRFQIRI